MQTITLTIITNLIFTCSLAIVTPAQIGALA
jgi:hypothetical protein